MRTSQLFWALVLSAVMADVFVSLQGSDTNNCTMHSPCKTIQRALSQGTNTTTLWIEALADSYSCSSELTISGDIQIVGHFPNQSNTARAVFDCTTSGLSVLSAHLTGKLVIRNLLLLNGSRSPLINLSTELFSQIEIVNTLFDSSDSGCLQIVGAMDSNTSVFIQDCGFKNCASLDSGGGVALLLPNARVNVEDTSFVNCSSSISGGGFMFSVLPNTKSNPNFLSLVNSSFTACFSNTGGGASFSVLAEPPTMDLIEVESCTFQDCHAEEGGGLFLEPVSAAIITINATKFLHCSADNGGGVLFRPFANFSQAREDNENYELEITSSEFNNCSAFTEGGGMLCDVQSDFALSMISTIFLDCQAHNASGGGLSLVHLGPTSLNVSLVFCTFLNCWCDGAPSVDKTGGGGGVAIYDEAYLSTCTVLIASTIFNGSEAKTNTVNGGGGGGLWMHFLHTNRTADVLLSNNSFIACASRQDGGGAIFFYALATFASIGLRIKDSQFINCRQLGVGWGGGAVFVGLEGGNSQHEISCRRSNFTNCSALGDGGGAVYLFDYTPRLLTDRSPITVKFIECNFLACSVIKPDNVTAIAGGGALYISGTSDHETLQTPMVAYVREWFYTTNVLVTNCTFFNNSGNCRLCNGGALYANGANTTVVNSPMIGNTAGLQGGAIYLEGTASITVKEGIFRENFSQDLAALVSRSPANVHVDGTLFFAANSFSIVVDEGAAVFVSNRTVTQCLPGYQQRGIGSGSYSVLRSAVNGTGYPHQYVFIIHSVNLGCGVCESGKYAISGAITHGESRVEQIACNECPVLGASCVMGGANILPLPEFWGLIQSIPGHENNATVSFLRCPSGFCVDDGAPSLYPFQRCAQGRTGQMCGECQSGHSQALFGTRCVDTTLCKSDIWFFPVVFTGALVYALFCTLPATGSDGESVILLTNYFFQLCAMILSTAPSIMDSVVQSAALQIGVGSTPSGLVCPLPGLSTFGSMWLSFFVPVAVATCVILLHLLGRCLCTNIDTFCTFKGLWSCCARRRHRAFVLRSSMMHSYGGSMDRAFLNSEDVTKAGLSLHWAIVKVGLFTYSTFTTATWALLRCMQIEGVHFLVRAPTVECGSWQIGLMILLAALCIVPLALFVVAQFGERWPLLATLQSMLKFPFKPKCGFWGSLLIVHILLSVFCATFGEDPILSCQLMCVLSGCALCCHLLALPFASPFVNVYQAVLLTALLLLGVFVQPQSMVSAGALDVDRSASAKIITLSVLVMPIPFVLKVLSEACAVLIKEIRGGDDSLPED